MISLHHHMTHEQPRMLFLHYWGRGTVGKLTMGLKNTLATQKAVPAPSHDLSKMNPLLPAFASIALVTATMGTGAA